MVNDSNNNVKKSNLLTKLDAVREVVVPVSDVKESTTIPSSPDNRRDDFKCTICNQVRTFNLVQH